MKIGFYRNLNKLETYSINKQQIKSHFNTIEDISISYGLYRQFKFDSRCPRPPKIIGNVVSSVSCNRDKKININFYPISQNIYSHKANFHFKDVLLPLIKQWIGNQISKPETAILGVEQLIIEWNGKTHLSHHIKFL